MTMLTASLNISDAGILAALGYGVVFLGLILLMIVVSIISLFFKTKKKPVAEQAPAPEPAPQPVAPGTAGELKLHNVEPKTAAMLMAIVANKLGKPLNELRFISIKEVK